MATPPAVPPRSPRPLLLATLLLVAYPRAARADERPTLSGSWTASPLSESWSLSDWGPACGPKPPSSGGGGGSVQIREQGGELSILGGGRAFSSAECWEQLPGMSRTSHSASGNGRFWRTRCSNAANDPRHAAVVTSLSATDSSISMSEVGEYQFNIQGTTCKATANRRRSYSLVRRDGEEPPAPSAAPAVPSASAPPEKSAKPPPERPAPRCTGTPGEPSRLEVHPARKVLKPGDRFTFRAVVLDGQGCPVGARPTFNIVNGERSNKAQVDSSGTITVAGDAPEGTISVSAAAFGKSVTVIVEVASPEHYDALLGQSGLNGQGEQDEPAVAVIATGTIGGKTAVAEDAAKERKVLFVSIVALLAAALGFAGLVIARRGRRPVTVPGEEGEPESGGPSSGGPSSGESSSGDAPGSEPSGSEAPGGDAPPGDPAGTGPAAGGPKQGARRKAKASDRGKICPTCGERYGSDATFCGKDGTTLVLLN